MPRGMVLPRRQPLLCDGPRGAGCWAERCPSEACTPSEGRSVAVDEDADGLVDEGCGYFFGTPHPVMAVVSSRASGFTETAHPTLSSDARTLTYASFTTGLTRPIAAQLRSVQRMDAGAPFEAPTVVVVEGLGSEQYVRGISASQNGLVAVVEYEQFGSRLIDVRRASATGPWQRVAPIADGRDAALSSDGLELFYASGGGLWRRTRITPLEAWSAPIALTGLASAAGGTSLSADNHALYFHAGSPSQLWVIERQDIHSAAFNAPVALGLLPRESVRSPLYARETRELFFTSNRPGTPSADATIWRVQVCRDHACEETVGSELIACEGTRSEDGTHCYRTSTLMTFSEATTWCSGLGGHLVSVHSDLERQAIHPTDGDLWLGLTADSGAWRWMTLEPVSYTSWFVLEPAPTAGACAGSNRGGLGTAWGTRPCNEARPAVCEFDLWPTW